jgi:hypothetical protein
MSAQSRKVWWQVRGSHRTDLTFPSVGASRGRASGRCDERSHRRISERGPEPVATAQAVAG